MIKTYLNYKVTDQPLLDKIPKHWDLTKLRFIGDFTSSGIDKNIIEGEHLVKIINYTDVYSNKTKTLGTDRDYMIVSCPESKLYQNLVNKGDLIFTPSSETINEIGFSALVDEELENTAFSYHVLRFVFFKEIDHSYKKYFCNNNYVLNYFSSESTGSTRKILGRIAFKNAFIALPPPEEQTKIAQYLDHQTSIIDQLIQQKEKLIELMKEKRQAVIIEAVTKGLNPNVKMKESGIEWLGEVPKSWDLIRLKFLYRIKKDIAGVLGHNVLSVTQKGIKIRDLNNLKGQLSMDYSKYQLVNQGDFIMNHMDLLTGYIDISQWNGVTSPDYRVFSRINDRVFDKYYLYIFQFCYANKIFFGLGQGVSQLGRWRMPSGQFNNFIVPLPSFEEQTEIVKNIESVIKNGELLSTLLGSQIEKLKEYRQSIISEAVTGKIDVRDWQPNKHQVA